MYKYVENGFESQPGFTEVGNNLTSMLLLDNDVGFCLIYPLQFHAPHVNFGNVFFEFKIAFSSNVHIVKCKFEL